MKRATWPHIFLVGLGCLAIATSGCQSQENGAIEVPSLQEGASAEYAVQGRPITHVNALKNLQGSTLNVEVGRAVRLIDPTGMPSDGIPFRYGMEENSLGEEYLSSTGGQLLNVFDVEVSSGGAPAKLVPAMVWGDARPDFFMATWFGGRSISSGVMDTPIFPHPGSVFAEIQPSFQWKVQVAGSVATLTMMPGSGAAIPGFTTRITLDETCSFPLTLVVTTMSGSNVFVANRLRCTPGTGPSLDLSAPDPRIADRSPLWQESDPRDLIGSADAEIDSRFPLRDALEKLQGDLQMQLACADCGLLEVAWASHTERNLLGETQFGQWQITLVEESGATFRAIVERNLQSGESSVVLFEKRPDLNRSARSFADAWWSLSSADTAATSRGLFSGKSVLWQWRIFGTNEVPLNDSKGPWAASAQVGEQDFTAPSGTAAFSLVWHLSLGGKLGSHTGDATYVVP